MDCKASTGLLQASTGLQAESKCVPFVPIDSGKKRPLEVHVTIAEIDDVSPFCKLCEEWTEWSVGDGNIDYDLFGLSDSRVCSCKPVIIVLPEGIHKQQPMCSMFVVGTVDQAIKWGELFGKYCLDRHSFTMIRNKVEARFHNVPDGVPMVRGQAIHESSSIYWEFHIKLWFQLGSEREGAEKRIEEFRLKLQHAFQFARLSRSALSSAESKHQGLTSRIVTLRLYEGSKRDARCHLDHLLDYLGEQAEAYNYSAKGTPEQELCVYDSNVSHDLGWIHMATSKEPCREDATGSSVAPWPTTGFISNKKKQHSVILTVLHILCFILLLCANYRDNARMVNLINTYPAEATEANLTAFSSSGTAHLMY